jgi:methyltransferase-like protein
LDPPSAPAGARERLAAARSFAESIMESTGDDDTNHARVLRHEVGTVLKAPDYYVVHDYMEESFEPIYFHEFAAMAAQHGLQYVGEARSLKLAFKVADRLRTRQPALAAGDVIRFEQCVDFGIGRQFRRTLLCHGGAAVRRPMDPARLMRCHLSAGMMPTVRQIDLRQNVDVTFRSADGGTFTTNDPVLKIALITLCAVAPLPLHFEAVWAQVCKAVNLPQFAPQRDALAQTLLHVFESDSLDAHLNPPRFMQHVIARPLASPLARWQAANGRTIHNRRHNTVRSLTPFDRTVLTRLDGTRDVAMLRAELAIPGADPGAVDIALRESLQRIAASAVLIA